MQKPLLTIDTASKEEVPNADIISTRRYLARSYAINQRIYHKIAPKFKIVLCYSRREFDKETRRKTGKWEAAIANKRRIFIFAPSVWDKLTDNNHSFSETLTHEMNHIFYMNFVGTFTPQWLIEGLAMLVDRTAKNFHWSGRSKPEYLAFSLKERWKIQSKSSGAALEFYKSSYLATKKLVDKIGMDGLVSLLRDYSKRPIKTNYRKLFDIYE